MFEAADDLRTEYAELERQLSDPSIHADLTKARKIGRRYSELTPIVRSLDAYHRLDGDLQAAKELADDDPAFAAEALTLQAEREVLLPVFLEDLLLRIGQHRIHQRLRQFGRQHRLIQALQQAVHAHLRWAVHRQMEVRSPQ